MSAKSDGQATDLLASRMDDLLSVPSWEERLASRDVSAVPSRRAALIVAMVSTLVLFVLLTILSPGSIKPPDPVTAATVMSLLGVCLVGGLLIGGWVWLDAAISRRRGGLSLVSFVLFYAAGGALLGLVLQALIPITGYASTAPPIIQILSIAAVGPWAAATVVAIQDGRRRFRHAQALLIHEVANVVMSSESQADLIDDLRAGLHRDLEATLQPAFVATERRLAFEEGFTRTRINSSAAEILNELTESSIRPITKRMGQSTARPVGLGSLWVLIVNIARNQPFRPLAVSGVFMLTVVADRWTVEGLESALVSTVVGVPLILLILGIGNRLMSAFPQRHGTLFVTFFLILQVPTYLVDILEGASVSIQYIGQVCLGVLMSGLIVWLTSGVGRWRAPKEELLRLYADEEKLLRFCREAGVAVTAYSPLGAPSYVPLGMAAVTDSLLDHPVVTEIARTVSRTPAQVLLRWGVQRGTAVIPKTSRPERLGENLALCDFTLSAQQMAAIDGLDQGRRFNDPGVFCEQAFNTFFPIYE